MKISNNSNNGDIIINGKKYNEDVDIEVVNNKIYIGKKETSKTPVSIRIDKELFDEVEKVKEKLNMSRTEFYEFLISQGLNTYRFSPITKIIFEVLSKTKIEESKKFLYIFFSLAQLKDNIKLSDVNYLAGTNVTNNEFIKICETVSIENYVSELEIIEINVVKKEGIDKLFSVEGLSLADCSEKDVNIKIKLKI